MLLGALVRLANIIYLRHVGDFLIGDAEIYHGEALLIAEGRGWIDPRFYAATGFTRQLAMHPPAYPAYLAAWSWIGVRSVLGHQLVTIPIGLASIVAVAWAGRRLFSDRVGIIAGAIAAVYPAFWSWDGMVLQESMAILAAALLLLAYEALIRAPSRRHVVWAGLASGFAPLVRAELLIGVVLAALWAIWCLGIRRSVMKIATAAVIAIACVAPWTIYNMTRFDHFVPLSNGFGVTLASTHCPLLDGDLIGYWSIHCANAASDKMTAEWAAQHPNAPEYPVAETYEEWERLRAAGGRILPPDYVTLRFPDLDESERDLALRDMTLEWMRDHPKFELRATLARWGRVTGVFRPLQQISLDTVPDGRKRPVAVAAWLSYFALLPFVVAGIATGLRRRRTATVLLLIPIVTMYITTALTFGNTRYRAIAEPSIVILAAYALARLAGWVQRTWNERYASPRAASSPPS